MIFAVPRRLTLSFASTEDADAGQSADGVALTPSFLSCPTHNHPRSLRYVETE